MGRIPDEIIQQLRDRADIVDLIGRFVSLKRTGRSYKGLCPFHEEKTPSFNVSPERQSFHCFGCQEGGNVFTFLMKVENLSFPEAARVLAREHGIEIPETFAAERGSTERLEEALQLAQDCYRRALAEPGNPGAAYLERRGLDAETIDRFEIGFAPPRWDTLVQALRSQRIPAEVGERAGLLCTRESGGHYDRLRGRVTFPIRDVRGRVIGFGGRAIAQDQEPKYLNTPESPLFRKREALYGFPAALVPIRQRERAVLVEGYFDRVALECAGVEGSLATCGTALTPEHARNLRRRTQQVVLLFDGDGAGQRAALRSLELLVPEGLRVRVAALPPGEDPDSFLREQGAEALRELVEAATPGLEFAIRQATARGCRTPWEKADAVARVAPLLALVPSAVERGELVRQLALVVESTPVAVERAVREAGAGRDPRDAMPTAPRNLGSEERKLRLLAQVLIDYPELAAEVRPEDVARVLPDHPLEEVLRALLFRPEAESVDELCERLPEAAGSLLRALAVQPLEIDSERARRTVDDTVGWLDRCRRRERQREITRRLRDPDADVPSLLQEKKELLTSPADPGGLARSGPQA